MSKKLLKKSDLGALVESVKKDALFVAPKTDARLVEYMYVDSADEIEFNYVVPEKSMKGFFFPQTETIASFKMRKGTVELEGTEIDPPETVIFGARPCDAASSASLRSVFTWDFIDEFYTKREDKATVISIACTKGDRSCFCTAVGLTPDATEGSDVLLRETEDGDFTAESVTDKGKEFIKNHKEVFSDAKDAKEKEIFKPEALDVDLGKIEKFLTDTEHYANPMWPKLAAKCVGCGACTFSCPTCHCFDITDEGMFDQGERKKNWDACQFDFFTMHASGHNPRDAQYKRWRNRFMCKFSIYPKKFSTKGCVGCGRCVRVCPVRLDITEVMQEISEQ